MNALYLSLYILLSIVLLCLSLQRPVWAVGYYMLNFFAQPIYWQWGQVLPGSIRWSLLAGTVLLVSVMIFPRKSAITDRGVLRTNRLMLFTLANATVVTLLFAYHPDNSWNGLVELTKFVVLHFLILATVQSPQDFRRFMLMFAIGLAFWGFASRFGDVSIIQGRLENFGGPGCRNSNELSSIVVSLLPVIGATLFLTRGWTRVLAVLAGGFGMNVAFLCNSRAGYLGLILGAVVLVFTSSGEVRRRALKGLAWGGLAVLVLAGNPQIARRFRSIFHDREQAEASMSRQLDFENKESRKRYWQAALAMIQDYPLGSGGNSFRSGKGNPYLEAVGEDARFRSTHEGFLREACDYGILGLGLHLSFVASSALCVLRTARARREAGDASIAFVGPCILAGMTAWLVTCLFGDMFHLEWGYWLVSLSVVYCNVYGRLNSDDLLRMNGTLSHSAGEPPSRERYLVRA